MYKKPYEMTTLPSSPLTESIDDSVKVLIGSRDKTTCFFFFFFFFSQ